MRRLFSALSRRNRDYVKTLPKVSAEAERFATTERAYRRVVSDLVEQGLVQRTELGLKPLDEDKLAKFIDSFDSR